MALESARHDRMRLGMIDGGHAARLSGDHKGQIRSRRSRTSTISLPARAMGAVSSRIEDVER